MKVQLACISVALAVATACPAGAADWGPSRGGVRDMTRDSGSPHPVIAVPAPVPIPDYKPNWYFRFDAGFGAITQPSFSESGYQYGQLINGGDGYTGSFAGGPDLQSLDPTWFSSDFSSLATFGGGVGYYLGGGWRIDATVEKRSNDQAEIIGSDSWESHSYYDTDFDGVNDTYGTDPSGNGDFDGDGSVADRRTTIYVTDRIDVDGTVWMANAYYDLGSRRGFTPYVGVGLGFVWNEFDRSHTTRIESCDVESVCTTGTIPVDSFTASDSASTISIAAAAMAGLSYDVTDITTIDIGYRYLFMGGTDFVMDIDGGPSRISIGDQHVHQIRAGLRFNVE